jgi:FkbM family methyltransferase
MNNMTPEELQVPHDLRQEGLKENEICIREGIVLTIHPESRFPFEFFTFRSPDMTLEMDCFIEYSKGRKSLLDIGAFHGVFAMVFAELNKDSKVYAFEPCQKVFEVLYHNALSQKNIKCYNRALSDGYGAIAMHEEWDHYVIGEPKEGEGAIVKCFSGDTFCEDYDFIDTIKCDCEVMELRVLKGLTKTISKYHPIIFLELHPERVVNIGDSVREIISMLNEWNYKAIDSRTNLPISYDEIEKTKNIDLRLILI